MSHGRERELGGTRDKVKERDDSTASSKTLSELRVYIHECTVDPSPPLSLSLSPSQASDGRSQREQNILH